MTSADNYRLSDEPARLNEVSGPGDNNGSGSRQLGRDENLPPVSLSIGLLLIVLGIAMLVFEPGNMTTMWLAMSDLGEHAGLRVLFSSVFAVLVTVGVCGVLSYGIVWAISTYEHWRSVHQNYLLAQIAMESRGEQVASAGTTERAVDSSSDVFVPWAVFAKLLRFQKAIVRTHGRPFTLLHLRPLPRNRTKQGTLAVTDVTRQMGKLLEGTLERPNLASQTTSGIWFVLLPETTQEIAENFVRRLAEQVSSTLAEDYRLDIRQFSYTKPRGTATEPKQAVA